MGEATENICVAARFVKLDFTDWYQVVGHWKLRSSEVGELWYQRSPFCFPRVNILTRITRKPVMSCSKPFCIIQNIKMLDFIRNWIIN